MSDQLKIIDQTLLDSLSDEAANLSRLRKNYNLHPVLEDPVQRLCNAMEPDTYVRPHRHPEGDKWELFIIIRGNALVLTFDNAGTLTGRIELCSTGPVYGVEIPTNTWHSVSALETGTVLFEAKKGPYQPLTDKDFAHWAPGEGEPECAKFVKWYKEAAIGSLPPKR